MLFLGSFEQKWCIDSYDLIVASNEQMLLHLCLSTNSLHIITNSPFGIAYESMGYEKLVTPLKLFMIILENDPNFVLSI